jgi:hypothetical protein
LERITPSAPAATATLRVVGTEDALHQQLARPEFAQPVEVVPAEAGIHLSVHHGGTGRAGLRPSRYQSDQVDKANGPLVRKCNRALRAAILGIADNLIVCNHHFQMLATTWRALGKDSGASCG